MTREEARRASVVAASTMTNVEALTNDFASPMTARPLGTFRSRNAAGDDAWLTVFRLFKPQVNDPDQACIWAWRDYDGPHFDEVQSVAFGHAPETMHERCVRFVFAHGFASRDQLAGDEEPRPALPHPQPMTPFGPLPRVTYAADVLPNDAFFLVGPSLEAPARVAPATCGFAGRVENAAQTRAVPSAQLAVTPSHPWSGISDGGARAWPADAITTTADRTGSFVFANLPFDAEGFDISIRALDYAPARIVHEECSSSDLAVGEWIIGSRPSFEDHTPHPVAQG
jgi:hypothetical protein